MRSTCSIYGNSPGHLNAGLQGGFGFGSFLWLGLPLKSMPDHVGTTFGLVFSKWGEEVWGFFLREKKKKNPVLVLITELMSTHVIFRHRWPTIIHVNMGLNKEMPFSLKSSRNKPTLRDVSFPIPGWNCSLPQEHLRFQR